MGGNEVSSGAFTAIAKSNIRFLNPRRAAPRIASELHSQHAHKIELALVFARAHLQFHSRSGLGRTAVRSNGARSVTRSAFPETARPQITLGNRANLARLCAFGMKKSMLKSKKRGRSLAC
jgi:hypothetical protein